MAAKKTPANASISSVKQTADQMLKSSKSTYKKGSRPIRSEATRDETARAIYIVERAQKMKAARDLYSSRWSEYERTWKMIEETRPEDEKWRANLPDTLAYASVRTAQAAFIDSEVVPQFSRNQDDDLMRANDMRDLYTDNARKGDQKFQLYLTRLDAFKLGTGFLMVYFEKDTRIRWDIDSFDPESDAITYKRTVVDVFSDPKTVRISPYLVLVDEQARADFKATARDCIVIELIPRSEAKLKYAHLFGSVDAFDKRVPTITSGTPSAIAETGNRGVATTAADNRGDVQARIYTFFAPVEMAVMDGGMCEVLHYYCVRPEDSHEITINGAPAQVKTAAWPSPLPYIHKELPIVPVRYALYSGDEFWGQGIIEVTRPDARALREHREMMSDRQKLSLFSPVFSDATDEIDAKLLKLRPLSIIRTRGGVPHQFRIQGITSADLQLTENYHASLKRATGIDEQLIGGNNQLSQHRFTATAIAFMRQTQFMRLKDFQFLYKQALLDEVRLKIKLFEQYYASPVKRAPHLKNEEGLAQLSVQAKEFSVKTGNVYTRKTVSSTLFTGPIENIDLEMNTLVPLTPAELITKWSQVIRDMTPFVQAGIIDLDMEKMAAEYLSALEVNINSLRKGPDDEAISMADGEHQMLSDKNTSQAMFDAILKDGTAQQFLTATHLKRHQQLISSDDEIEAEELKNIIAHIAMDTKNYETMMQQQAAAKGANMDTFANSPMTAGIGAPDSGGSGHKPPSVSMSYKDAPDDVRRQIEEAAGLHPSEAAAVAGGGKAPHLDVSRTGTGMRDTTESTPLLGNK